MPEAFSEAGTTEPGESSSNCNITVVRTSCYGRTRSVMHTAHPRRIISGMRLRDAAVVPAKWTVRKMFDRISVGNAIIRDGETSTARTLKYLRLGEALRL